MKESTILTKKALQVINKKIQGRKLTQQDSNYLSRFVRPKLREMSKIEAQNLLKKLEYSPRAKAIERRIIRLILDIIPKTESIILCGSAIQTNYNDYEDIDIIIATKNVLNIIEKRALVDSLTEKGKKQGLILDVQIYAKRSIISQYASNPSLIYQLKDSKQIYGKLSLPKKINLSNLDLKMKLDWSEGLGTFSEPKEIYHAIRNAMLVSLLLNKIVDNSYLNKIIAVNLGNDLVAKIKNNQATKEEKKTLLSYLYFLTNYLENELDKNKWESIKIEKH